MKKAFSPSALIFCISVVSFMLCTPCSQGQVTKTPSPALPGEINKIVSVSCVPCHTDKGGLMSKTKLNFTIWTQYSPAKQKERALMMSSMLEKDKMPPKEAREKRPEIVPTKEQKEIIIKWAKSFKSNQ